MRESPVFPEELRPYVEQRTEGDMLVNLLVNYGWQWDVSTLPQRLRSRNASRIDLMVRWSGRQRLSGFLPIQCAYADPRRR